jgi:hypothetical protein
MPWVEWVDGAVVGNTMSDKKGVGDNWKEVTVEPIDSTSNQIAQIVEENGMLYKRGVDVTLTYQQKRMAEYPHYRDQLDMMYKDQVNGTTTWKDKITEIKERHPKE